VVGGFTVAEKVQAAKDLFSGDALIVRSGMPGIVRGPYSDTRISVQFDGSSSVVYVLPFQITRYYFYFMQLCQYEYASCLLRACLDALPEGHPGVTVALCNLAISYRVLGRYKEFWELMDDVPEAIFNESEIAFCEEEVKIAFCEEFGLRLQLRTILSMTLGGFAALITVRSLNWQRVGLWTACGAAAAPVVALGASVTQERKRLRAIGSKVFCVAPRWLLGRRRRGRELVVCMQHIVEIVACALHKSWWTLKLRVHIPNQQI
jgi:hypothetical protein